MIWSSQSESCLEPLFYRYLRLFLLDIENTEFFIRIYSDAPRKIDRAWREFERLMDAKIQEKIINDDVIKKITNSDLEKLCKLECYFDVQILVEKSNGNVRIKGHIDDIPNIQGEIIRFLKDIKDSERKGKILTS